MTAAFKAGDAHAGLQFTTREPWIGTLGISWYLGVDGPSVFLVAMTALLFPIAISVTPEGRPPRAYLGWMLLLESACMVTFLSLNGFLFFVAFDLSLVPGYFIIIDGPGPRQGYAATKFFLYTFAGSAFLFVGILAAYFLASGTSRRARLRRWTSSHSLGGRRTCPGLTRRCCWPRSEPPSRSRCRWCPFTLGCPMPTPRPRQAVPWSWQARCSSGAPTASCAGAFSFSRWGGGPGAARSYPGRGGHHLGALVATVQRDLKRLVAYGTLVGIGFMVAGLFGFTAQDITGAVVDMVNHGLSTRALFLLVGMVWARRRAHSFAELGGLSSAAPVLGWVFMAVVLSDIGLPGLNGFIGELLVLLGTFVPDRWWAMVATTGVVLSAVYLLWAYQRVFQGSVRGALGAVRDMTWAERVAVAPLLAGIVFIGVYLGPVLTRIQPAVDHLIAHMEYADPSLKLASSMVGHGIFAVPADQVVDLPAARSATAGRSPDGSRP